MTYSFQKAAFHPRIGKRYGKAPYGFKLLVLGESHYRWPDHPEDETTITRVALEENWDHHRFFLSLEKLIPLPQGQHGLRGWDTVAFYNYVQEFVGDRPRDRPTDEMWSSVLTVSAFSEVLEICKPDRILVVGKTTWRMMAGKDEVPENPPILEPSFPLPDSFCAGLNPESERNAYWYSTGAGSWALAAPIFHTAYTRPSASRGTGYVNLIAISIKHWNLLRSRVQELNPALMPAHIGTVAIYFGLALGLDNLSSTVFVYQRWLDYRYVPTKISFCLIGFRKQIHLETSPMMQTSCVYCGRSNLMAKKCWSVILED